MRLSRSVAMLAASAAISVLLWAIRARLANAHCDTMDGPVVTAAKLALDKGDSTPVLKWVREPYEGQVRAAFARALAVRKAGPEARELADMYFFETLVRLHRAGEGAAYAGLQPSGTPVSAAVQAADAALETGSVEALEKLLAERVATGIRERFERARRAKKHAEESVEQGRQFVEAYVDFTHYAEHLYELTERAAVHHAEPEQVQEHAPHGH